MNSRLWVTSLVVALLSLTGCANRKTQEQIQAERYHINQDRAHLNVDVADLPDAVPRAPEGTVKKAPYSLNGKTYRPRETAAGYQKKGIASWYGTKFHGYKTANGEIYDMYAMSAAHKTLPLPSYARVTNLANGRSVIVRVNDRGPFHGNRLIDLSWAAAKKLGYQSRGIANVVVEGIDTSPEGMLAFQQNQNARIISGTDADDLLYLQVAALGSKSSALDLKQRLLTLTETSVQVVAPTEDDKLFRVRIGPLSSEQELERMRADLREASLGPGLRIYD